MNNFEFAGIAANIADGKYGATCYMLGPWGWPTTDKMITRATTQGSNVQKNRTWKPAALAIKNRGYIFDCVGLIKGILWGWDGDRSKSYGGAGYACNGVPDIGADTMISKCSPRTDGWDDMPAGAVVWMPGHIGIHVGGGVCIEATPRWDGGVQQSAIFNRTDGRALGWAKTRTWKKWGLLPWVDYSDREKPAESATDEPSPWAAEAWNAAKAAGITDGSRPHDPATREQVIAMLFRSGVIT